MAYEARNDLVRNRQIKVQRLVIPFTITGSATPSAVVLRSDEPGILFLKSQGVDQITGALDSGEASPTYVAQNDASGAFSALVVLKEQAIKIQRASIIKRDAATAGDYAYLANTTGISANGDKICLNCKTSVDLSAANLDACLMVEYITDPSERS